MLCLSHNGFPLDFIVVVTPFWEKVVLRQWNALHLMITRRWRYSEYDLVGLCCCFFALAELCLFAAQLVLLLVQVKMLMLNADCTLHDCVHECLVWFKTGSIRLDTLAAVTEELLQCVALVELLLNVHLRAESNLCLQQYERQRELPSFLGLCYGGHACFLSAVCA